MPKPYLEIQGGLELKIAKGIFISDLYLISYNSKSNRVLKIQI